MRTNPFVSSHFKSIWLKHFSPRKEELIFNFIDGLSFEKQSIPFFFINIGRNNTKGLSYSLSDTKAKDYRKKIFLIYDVPEYFALDIICKTKKIGLKRINQYPGFLIDLRAYNNLEDYLKENFGKKSRSTLRKCRKRLEGSFHITYKMFCGSITPQEYGFIFEHFRLLLVKRFAGKQTTNNNLNPKEWAFFKEVSLPLILEKKASLFVVYNEHIPIAITLSFMDETTLINTLTVFDTDYSKFNLGYTSLLGLTAWCFKNSYEVLDFSKGYFDYKKRWGNQTYTFEYHILYDRQYLPAMLLANIISLYFRGKQLLRTWGINKILHKTTYFLSAKKKTRTRTVPYEISEVNALPAPHTIEAIPINSPDYNAIKKQLYSFLYLFSEALKDVTVYVTRDRDFVFFHGKHHSCKICLKQMTTKNRRKSGS